MKRPYEFTSTGVSSYTLPFAYDPHSVTITVERVTVYSPAWYSILGKTLAFTANAPDSAAIIHIDGEVAK